MGLIMTLSDDLTYDEDVQTREQRELDLEHEAAMLRVEEHRENMRLYCEYIAQGYSEYEAMLWSGRLNDGKFA